jgi:hypothetical protein
MLLECPGSRSIELATRIQPPKRSDRGEVHPEWRFEYPRSPDLPGLFLETCWGKIHDTSRCPQLLSSEEIRSARFPQRDDEREKRVKSSGKDSVTPQTGKAESHVHR